MTSERFLRPEQILADVIEKGGKGLYLERGATIPFLLRAIVVAVDVEGGKLENPKGDGSLSHQLSGKSFQVPATIGPKNPANSVKARIITGGRDQFIHDDRLRVFWPFFDEHVSTPVKPGEYVYVMFEDEGDSHGLWISKISGHEGVNYARGRDFFVEPGSTSLASKFPDTKSNSDSSSKDKDVLAAQCDHDGRLSNLFGVK